MRTLKIAFWCTVISLSLGCGPDGCKIPPPPPDNTITKIYYHYSFDISTQDLIRFKDNTSLLNNLCKKLEFPFEFERVMKEFDRPEAEYIESLSTDKINVILGKDEKVYSGAHFHLDNKMISIARNDWYNPSLLLHEIIHYKTQASLHVTDNKVGQCLLPKANGCMNLMSNSYYTPYNFLLTEIQHQKCRKARVTANCGNGHVYPKDLISEDIESNFSCCPKIDYNNYKSKIDRWLQEVYEPRQQTSSKDKIIDALKNFEKANLCPFMDNSESIEFLNEGEIVRILEEIQEVTFDQDGNSYNVISQNAIDIPVNVFVDANYISYKMYLEQFKNDYHKEAIYLTNGTDVPAKRYKELRLKQIEFYFKEIQKELDSKRIFNTLE